MCWADKRPANVGKQHLLACFFLWGFLQLADLQCVCLYECSCLFVDQVNKRSTGVGKCQPCAYLTSTYLGHIPLLTWRMSSFLILLIVTASRPTWFNLAKLGPEPDLWKSQGTAWFSWGWRSLQFFCTPSSLLHFDWFFCVCFCTSTMKIFEKGFLKIFFVSLGQLCLMLTLTLSWS
jgi:hypothetical protein